MSASQTCSDAAAFARLDELLDLDEPSRIQRLRTLSSENPALHARLLRLLAAATAADLSQVLAMPVLGGLHAAHSAASLALAAGAELGGYRLLRELGRGGMSAVWLAERLDGVVKREVALKLPLFALSSALDVARFEQERDVLASLNHPHIARLYDAGITAHGQPFFVLEYIDGLPLTTYCNTHCLDLRARLQLFLQVLAAVEHAHQHMVVHRDLKPSNILVDSQGQVKLLDFGIAKLLSASSEPAVLQTQLGAAVLTPLYSAPEQITQAPITTLADVYVLGLVLYELLSGVLPYRVSDTGQMSLQAICEAQASLTAPSRAALSTEAAQRRTLLSAGQLRSALTGDLDTIALQALRFDPQQRYGSAEQFAQDVQRFLEQRPITARPASIAYVAKLFVRRHRGTSMAIAIGLLCSLAALMLAAAQWRESLANAERSRIMRDFMYDLVGDAEPDAARPGEPVTGRQMIDGAVRRARSSFTGQPALQGELLGELARMYRSLGEPQLALPVFEEALQLLENNAPASAAALNKTRAYLAGALARTQRDRARSLAIRARTDCTRRSIDCAKARAYANTTLAGLYSTDGAHELASSAMREAVRETSLAFGDQHRETAYALQNLAVIERNAGNLEAASRVLQRALDASAALSLPAGDRQELLRSMALLDYDLGRYRAAQRRLTELLKQPSRGNERAVQLRILANVHLAAGQPQAALLAAEQALSLADTEHPSTESFFARESRARALAMLGRVDAAIAEIHAVLHGLAGLGVAADGAVMVHERRVQQEILLRAGRVAEALPVLQALLAQQLALPRPPALEMGQAFELLGCAWRELGKLAAARTAHARARGFLQKILPADHPFLERNTLYMNAAAGNREGFARAAVQFARRFEPTSLWRQLLDAQSNPAACALPNAQRCTLIL